jgi:hypothetical protein
MKTKNAQSPMISPKRKYSAKDVRTAIANTHAAYGFPRVGYRFKRGDWHGVRSLKALSPMRVLAHSVLAESANRADRLAVVVRKIARAFVHDPADRKEISALVGQLQCQACSAHMELLQILPQHASTFLENPMVSLDLIRFHTGFIGDLISNVMYAGMLGCVPVGGFTADWQLQMRRVHEAEARLLELFAPRSAARRVPAAAA